MSAASRRGREARSLGDIAEQTLRELFTWWLGDLEFADPSFMHPDAHKVDIKLTVPSLWDEVPPIEMLWQVKSTGVSPRTKRVQFGKPLEPATECLVFPMSKSDFLNLRTYARSYRHLYIALGVQKVSCPPHELYSVSPFGRFDWFVVDAAQQLEPWTADDSPTLYFPIQNKLNLSTFSLLWGANWVEAFFAPLSDPGIREAPPELDESIRSIFPRSGVVDDAVRTNWDFFTSQLPRFSRELDVSLFKAINLRVGLGNALAIINGQLVDVAGKVDSILTYCPESLYGTANLWLFSRSYHTFMRTTETIARNNVDGSSHRYLPVDGEIDDVPNLLRAALYNVMVVYACMGAGVHLVRGSEVDIGGDRSYYGGGIGHFPWVSLSSDNAVFTIETSQDATSGVHLDFLHQISSDENVFVSMPARYLSGSDVFQIPSDQLLTPGRAPQQFFPKETNFLEYPPGLFDSNRVRAILNK